MSDEMATAQALGGKFEREDCGFFELCNHKVEKYDMTIPGGSIVDIYYCAIDWKKVGPIILLMFMFFVYAWRKTRTSSKWSSISSNGNDKYAKYYKK